MLSAYLNGFGVAFSLILAIGAQNAFVLKQGLRREYVLPIALVCALSDAILITVGVFGFAALTNVMPSLAPVMLWLGALFLLAYGAFSFWRAWKGGAGLDPASGKGLSLKAAVMFCLAITWLNPHVYLDTVMLIGSVATQFPGFEVGFWAGAVTSSFTFFFGLGYGARLLAPVMAKPLSWRVLEALIGCVMWAIAYGLIRGA
ncbi:LysE/ArgO family amino acid transporter [Octadecabacter sp. 1_MG-2023]|uniref:LysE/ArgO family amino acid transporter n=1 Tax=unclassified Octadecabacter TaxID=196158 RepID=UPI001C08ACA7|nr:LysE/ArgO family amino acid transporter [Octadecabacter sp. 1_MG-2023]MBU2992733.1 LysE/ArgO family amino acid transporter [Octadecabacter sp. B2R22]MDO6733816.1 LysE/ArgO family amino acid transporter [Octadecabacter sp. 1_MG-2023]